MKTIQATEEMMKLMGIDKDTVITMQSDEQVLIKVPKQKVQRYEPKREYNGIVNQDT